MKKFAISDIHGCYHTLVALLSKVNFTKYDQLFLLGDYINRGPKSKEVVDYIMAMQTEGYHIIVLKGNHEEMVFDSLELGNWTDGEPETLKSFGIKHLRHLDKKYVTWFKNLKSYYIDKDFLLVHAGFNFQFDNPFEDRSCLSWITNWHETINYKWLENKTIVHGHQPQTAPAIKKMLKNLKSKQVINIDNGCNIRYQNGFGSMCCFELTNQLLTFQENID